MSIVGSKLRELEITQTTKFVLPMLYTKDRNDEFFITKQFKNCYIGDTNREELGQGIFLLYKYKTDVSFIKFERSLELIPEYNLDYDYSDDNDVMFVFDIPEDQKENFELFKSGKYSLFGDNFKKQILSFWGIEGTNNPFYEILYPVTETEVKPIELSKEIYSFQ